MIDECRIRAIRAIREVVVQIVELIKSEDFQNERAERIARAIAERIAELRPELLAHLFGGRVPEDRATVISRVARAMESFDWDVLRHRDVEYIVPRIMEKLQTLGQ